MLTVETGKVDSKFKTGAKQIEASQTLELVSPAGRSRESSFEDSSESEDLSDHQTDDEEDADVMEEYGIDLGRFLRRASFENLYDRL